MNDDQLDMCLRSLKSSSCEPAEINVVLEERMMNLFSSLKKREGRTRRLATAIALLLIGGTGFIALGGDSMVMNYIVPTSTVDEFGNAVEPPVPRWGGLMRHIHDHLWRHWHGHSQGTKE